MAHLWLVTVNIEVLSSFYSWRVNKNKTLVNNCKDNFSILYLDKVNRENTQFSYFKVI